MSTSALPLVDALSGGDVAEASASLADYGGGRSTCPTMENWMQRHVACDARLSILYLERVQCAD